MLIKLKAPLIGWKKCYLICGRDTINVVRDVVVKLRIPKGTWIHASGLDDDHKPYKYSKHRAAKAKVLGFFKARSKKQRLYIPKNHHVMAGWQPFFYRQGATVKPKGRKFLMRNEVCGPGIHFFTDFNSARSY